ncbi:ABC transporter permease [Streptococcus sanguinis]|uniref:ABC transporter permease n=1 Tax=Streptococcus sanguinis TaxID=1305 RepID=UPI001D1555A9|nr:ABC transporter permease [Streptococcus sanguinis]MCC3168795.1 binding-protein-dependent transport system inner membrane component family protein [Streptococcus sanguinis]
MIKFIIKTILQFVLILLCVSFISFLLVYLAPGDPAESILNAQGIPFTKELLEIKRAEMGLNGSFMEQYLAWLGRIVHGDFGVTYNSGASVWEQLVFYFPNTVYLAFYTLLATLGISLPTALYTSYHAGKPVDRFLMAGLAFLNAIPSFVMGIILILIFSVQLHWFPIQATANELGLVLPVMTLAMIMSTRYIPQLRTALIEVLHSPEVEGARGRGIREGHILLHDVIYNVLPFLLTLVSLSLGSLLGGVAIIEHLFSWPGIGKMLIGVVAKRDYPLVQGAVLFITAGVLTVNLVFQLLMVWLNPRVRLAQENPKLLPRMKRLKTSKGGSYG